MDLEFKPDMRRVEKYWDAFWQKEIIDRPCCVIKSAKTGVEQKCGLTSNQYLQNIHTEQDYDRVIDMYDMLVSQTYWGGEAIPFVQATFGPDQFGAFLGAEIKLNPETYTSWVDPIISDWAGFEPKLDYSVGSTLNRLLDFISYCCEKIDGKYLLSMPDTHSNLDAMSAIRNPMDMCYDLMDCPDEVEKVLLKMCNLHHGFMDKVIKAGNFEKAGYIGWAPTWSRGRFAVVQCDFACLMTPEQGKKLLIPAIADEAAYFDNCVYHYDGKEALIHLDGILDIKDIDVIQWVPGDGNPRSIFWMNLLKKIQSKGKGLWIYDWSVEEIKQHFKELKPQGLVFEVNVKDEREGEELLEFLKKNT